MNTPLRILVVDDVHDVADTVVRLLTLMGHDCAAAYGGSEAIQLARRFAPHVLLIDFGMPGMTGPELLLQLRAVPTLRESVMVAHTAYGDASHEMIAMEAGFDAFLVKPVEVADIVQVLFLVASRRGADASTLVLQ